MPFTGLTTPIAWTDDEAEATQPWSATGYFRNMIIRTVPAPSGTLTYTMQRDAADTALAVVLSGVGASATARNTTALQPVSAGDKLALKLVRSSGSAIALKTQVTVEYVSQSGESGYGFQALHIPSLVGPTYAPLFGFTSAEESIWASDLVQSINIVPCAGRITRYDLLLTVAPGGSGLWTATIVKNNIEQDGSI